ncbi:MAG: SdpI family protein, partial [Cyclobacteriaceae bacterium]|nr:SdpI family protein [Cyclobacteriaceae bacterium]
INRIVGYRTPRSMKSQKAWEFAQVYSARLMLKLSICLLSVAAIGFAVGNIGILGAALGFLSFIFASGAVIILTERKLRALEVSSSGEVMQP